MTGAANAQPAVRGEGHQAARKAFKAQRKPLRGVGYILRRAERGNGRPMLSATRRDEVRLFVDTDAAIRFADAIGAPLSAAPKG